MNDREFEEALKGALRGEASRDDGFWARQRARTLSRLPERRRGWGRWAWAPAAAAALAALALWPRPSAVAPAVPPGLLADMDVLQDLDLAEELELIEEMDDAEVGL